MNPPSNTGSFGSAIGGMSPELAAAVSRRSGSNPSGPMGQVSNSAPTADPTTQMPPPSTGMPPQAPTGPSMPGLSQGLPSPSETEIILKSLDSRLKSLSKVQEANNGIR